MRFNTRVRYGLRAMLEIALDNSESGVFQKDIASRQKISLKYLDNIIASLKAADLIINKKGKKSGYRLSRKPDEIKVHDIYKAFESGICVIDCISGSFRCDRSEICGVRGFWTGLNQIIIDYFESYTLEDLVKEHRRKVVTAGNTG